MRKTRNIVIVWDVLSRHGKVEKRESLKHTQKVIENKVFKHTMCTCYRTIPTLLAAKPCWTTTWWNGSRWGEGGRKPRLRMRNVTSRPWTSSKKCLKSETKVQTPSWPISSVKFSQQCSLSRNHENFLFCFKHHLCESYITYSMNKRIRKKTPKALCWNLHKWTTVYFIFGCNNTEACYWFTEILNYLSLLYAWLFGSLGIFIVLKIWTTRRKQHSLFIATISICQSLMSQESISWMEKHPYIFLEH